MDRESFDNSAEKFRKEQNDIAFTAGKQWGITAPAEQYIRLRNSFLAAPDKWASHFLNDKNPLATFFTMVIDPTADKMNPVGPDSFWAANCSVASTPEHVQSFAVGALKSSDSRHDSIR
jgi:hypothetical protein